VPASLRFASRSLIVSLVIDEVTKTFPRERLLQS
jgi:hypothetical protein